MDNIQSQIIGNFKSLFGRYKAVVAENDRVFSVTVDGTTASVQKVRSTQITAATKL